MLQTATCLGPAFPVPVEKAASEFKSQAHLFLADALRHMGTSLQVSVVCKARVVAPVLITQL